MLDHPRTKEQAEKYRYGTWAGNPEGNRYRPKQCAYEAYQSLGAGGMFYQCTRKSGHGPAKLYCKQHAKKIGGRE